MPVRGFHITFETDTHFGEAECECEYKADPDSDPVRPEYYPVRGTMQFFEIELTDKKTGLTEDADEMPEGIVNTARDAAEEQFEL